MDSSPVENVQDVETDNNETANTTKSREKRKDVPRSSGATSQPTKVTKILDPRSSVWESFTRLAVNRDKAFCHYCKKNLACKSKNGTKGLSNHLLICKEHTAWKESQLNVQPIINEEGLVKSGKVSEAIFREATNEMLVLGELTLSFVESVAYKHYCKKVKLYKPHSRRTATRDIVGTYVKKKEALKKWFSITKQRVSLTTDIWVAETTGASYMVITAHFIDENWEMKKLIIGFKYVSDHKGRTISTVLLECLADWGIERVFSVSVDNATANGSALRTFHREFQKVSTEAFVMNGDYLHVRCCAHIINLIVREGLADISDSVAAIRNGILYVRSHTNRMASFEQKVDLGRVKRGSLPLDVKTRWNSTYNMLEKALEFRLAFDRMKNQDKLYNDHFLELDNGETRIGPPSVLDWDEVSNLNELLFIFYESTLVMSISNRPASYLCYGEIVTIERSLNGYATGQDKALKSKAELMLLKFRKYWNGMKDINKMLIIASIFDPKKKLNFARMCFEKLHGTGSVKARDMSESLYLLTRSMFKEYNDRCNKRNSQAVQSSQSSSLSGHNRVVDRTDLAKKHPGYERMEYMYNEILEATGVEDPLDELDRYLKEPVANPKMLNGMEFNVLSWWKDNSSKYPVLAEMARDLLAMQVSSVASESAFSTSGRILDPYRSSLTHYMIEVLMCEEQWLKVDIMVPETESMTKEQIQAEFQMMDEIEKEHEIHNRS